MPDADRSANSGRLSMTRIRLTVLIAACLALAAPGTFAQATKQAAKPALVTKAADPAAKVPAPILAAFKQAYPNATIKAAAKEMENGKIEWEVESIDNGLARDLVYNPDGTVVEIEEQVAPASLPAAVTDAIKVKYPKATITKAEKLMKGAALTYEMALTGAAVKSIEITPDGKIVPSANEKGEKNEKEDGPKKK
jgi:hypothetical protein